jgi:peptide/nickel transport system ATP-binding protein
MSDILVDIKNLNVDFNTPDGMVRAVADSNFQILKGKTVGLVGESGSGKSVSALAMMGLIPNPPGIVSSGEILFNGQDLLKFSEREMRKIRGNKISMIFQEPMTSLNPVFRVGDQISESLILHKKLSKKEAWEQAVHLMDQVGIPNPSVRALSYPHELSGGQKQRVMIAMAISCEPDLLICDEPTTALDVTIQKQVLDLMLDLQDKYDMSMLFITHDLAVIADIADEVIVMYRSRIVEKNHSENIFVKPNHPYSKGLIACRPGLETNPKRLLTVSDFMDEKGNELKVPESKLEVFHKPYTFSETENPVLLEVKDLKTYFPIRGGFFKSVQDHVKAVDDVSFQLRKGKTLGLVGESGCGKTTLGRSILRLVEPTAGKVFYRDKEITSLDGDEMRKMRSVMQIIFQDPYSSLNPRMTIGDIVTEPMEIHQVGANKKERIQMAESLLEEVGLDPRHLVRYPHEFSGGQRQRISIARALSLKPEFIICDESVSALDVSVQAQVLNLLLDLQDQYDLTYIFISHDLSVVNFISDDVGVMYNGKIVEMGAASEVYNNPQMDYTKKLLKAIPKGRPKHLLQN